MRGKKRNTTDEMKVFLPDAPRTSVIVFYLSDFTGIRFILATQN